MECICIDVVYVTGNEQNKGKKGSNILLVYNKSVEMKNLLSLLCLVYAYVCSF